EMSAVKALPRRQERLGRRAGLSANSTQFLLEGQPFQILGGSVHYFRVPRPYWRDRLLKMKACGINTLTTAVPWSLHQPQKEVFSFHSQLDLEAFINLAADLGLWVILRPGPYISSELDLGGLPSWLLRDSSMRLRTMYPGFTQAVNVYFDKLIPKMVPLQFKKGGPIVAVQVENEYGSFAKDDSYLLFIKEALKSRGISELLLTSDRLDTLEWGGVDGGMQATLPTRSRARGHTHLMDSLTRELVSQGMSVNLYMFHGGSSFGFMTGALGEPSYKALVPSYDYDAPLSEAGEYTPKYHILRDLLSRFTSMGITVTYQHLSLWDALSYTEGPFRSPKPVNMENLPVNNNNGQAYGYTLYETTITSGGSLKSGDSVRDRALVFVDRSYIGLLKHKRLELAVPGGKGPRTLSLLVENCGRVHQGGGLDKQRKGLVGEILLNNIPLRDFTIYSLDMKPSFIDRFVSAPWKTLSEGPTFPGFFMGRIFVYGYPSDTFVKLPAWKKGVVFINGLNLGRYWSIGPQQTLYLPGPFLNSGINQVIVFEEQEGDYSVHFEDTPDLGMAADL
uniref:Galactosidase beta 1 like 2 n=1 Tax=Takifugu rubripes TaxID=31033 RepID=A0A674P8A0_TAKRU